MSFFASPDNSQRARARREEHCFNLGNDSGNGTGAGIEALRCDMRGVGLTH